MPTADRATLRVVMDEVLTVLRGQVVANPPTADKPFRRIEAGIVDAEAGPRPVLGVVLSKARPVGSIDNDKVWEATTQLVAVVDLTGADAHGGMLDVVGAVEDALDGLMDVGVVEGSDGFDNRAWSFEYPVTRSGARVGVARATQTFVVRVEREQNRVPA